MVNIITVNIKYIYIKHTLSCTLTHLRALAHAHTHENSRYIYVYLYIHTYIYIYILYDICARVMPEKSLNTP